MNGHNINSTGKIITVTNKDRSSGLSSDAAMNITVEIYSRVTHIIRSGVNEMRLPEEVIKLNNLGRIPL